MHANQPPSVKKSLTQSDLSFPQRALTKSGLPCPRQKKTLSGWLGAIKKWSVHCAPPSALHPVPPHVAALSNTETAGHVARKERERDESNPQIVQVDSLEQSEFMTAASGLNSKAFAFRTPFSGFQAPQKSLATSSEASGSSCKKPTFCSEPQPMDSRAS